MVCWSLILLLCLTGCVGRKEEVIEDTETTLYIQKDGTIESLIVEDFPEDIYSSEELSASIGEMVDFYNHEHESGAVRLVFCRVENGQAFVRLAYKSGQDYAQFNRTDFFYGTVSDALAQGYGKKATLKNAYGDNMVSGETIADLASYHMVVVNEQVQIRTYESILYYSANLEHIDDKTVHVNTEDGKDAIMILK